MRPRWLRQQLNLCQHPANEEEGEGICAWLFGLGGMSTIMFVWVGAGTGQLLNKLSHSL